MAKGRPGGNPEIATLGKRYRWKQPCSARRSLRMPPLMKDALDQLPGWQEICRQAIAKHLPPETAKELGWPFEPSEKEGTTTTTTTQPNT